MREAFNAFLKMYFDSCREVYEELNIKDVNEGRFKYLREIDKHGSMTMSELAESFNLSKPTVTETIRKFEKAELIERHRCDDDGRVVNIKLTERGKLLAKTNMLESDRALEKVYARLTESELKTLMALFNKIGQVTTWYLAKL